ncbi:MAG: T9SS type A sorting domain-containing protein [Bacteroidota bacterium]|nr:T9SS type A sorting domain-containing protein [Bacteroidota bacterium]
MWTRSNADDLNIGPNTSLPVTVASISLPYFPKIYSGFGIEHMNINLVSLKLTGLNTGDEIGVFDGIYCVGSMVITENHMLDNSISIPTSANDSLGTAQNGYIQGHKITLKVYRTGKVYLLYFQSVNNTQDIFERRGSMFALVDFSRSTGQTAIEDIEKIKIYPNPFTSFLKIEINILKEKNLSIAIFDMNGKLIRTLFEGIAEGQLQANWDGKDNSRHQVPSGVYFCRVNQTIYGIIYQGIGLN